MEKSRSRKESRTKVSSFPPGVKKSKSGVRSQLRIILWLTLMLAGMMGLSFYTDKLFFQELSVSSAIMVTLLFMASGDRQSFR